MKKQKKIFIYEMLDKVQKGGHEVIVWYSIDYQYTQVKFKISYIRKSNNDFIIIPEKGAEIFISQVVSGSEELKVYFPLLSMVCSSRIKKIEKNKNITLEFPEETMLVERRSDERLQSFKETSVMLEWKGQKDVRRCFDISLGGFSIFISNSSKLRVDISNGPINATFNFLSGKIKIICELTNLDKVKPFSQDLIYYGGERVSFKFLNITKKDKENLKQLIESILPHKKSN